MVIIEYIWNFHLQNCLNILQWPMSSWCWNPKQTLSASLVICTMKPHIEHYSLEKFELSLSKETARVATSLPSFNTTLLMVVINIYAALIWFSWIILCIRPANERQCYIVTSSHNTHIGWAHTQNDPWILGRLAAHTSAQPLWPPR